MGYAYLWEFRVAPEQLTEFQRHYGPRGSWVVLFREAAGYLGTSLLRDRSDPLRFVTLDRWENEQAYLAFRGAFATQYAQLDRRCQHLTTRETFLGAFDETDAYQSS